MAKHSTNDILSMENPYRELGSSDALAKHGKELSQLSASQMNQVAKKLVINCPDDEINDFSHRKEALKNESPEFYPILSKALEIRQRSNALLDQQNPNPHDQLTGDEFNADLYNEFGDLFPSLTQEKANLIALRLAETTPNGMENELVRNLGNIGAESLSQMMGKSFQLRHDIKGLLLSDTPADFFSNEEFNVDTCHQFLPLICRLIDGKEATIGEKLAQAPKQMLKDISSKLEQLNSDATDANNPFRVIAESLNIKAEQRSSAISEGRKHFGAFPSADPNPTELRKRNTSQSNESESDNEDEDKNELDNQDEYKPQCCSII